MTVQSAKGLEFPVVILADMTAKLRSASASRYIDSERGACAIRIAGCSPFDLIQHELEELACDEVGRLAHRVRRRDPPPRRMSLPLACTRSARVTPSYAVCVEILEA